MVVSLLGVVGRAKRLDDLHREPIHAALVIETCRVVEDEDRIELAIEEVERHAIGNGECWRRNDVRGQPQLFVRVLSVENRRRKSTLKLGQWRGQLNALKLERRQWVWRTCRTAGQREALKRRKRETCTSRGLDTTNRQSVVHGALPLRLVAETKNATLTFTWDNRDRLTAIHSSLGSISLVDINYKYDAFNRLVQRSETRYTSSDGGEGGTIATTTTEDRVYDANHVVLDFLNTGSGFAIEHRYLYGNRIDQLLAQENADGTVYWMMTDNQGTVRDLIDNTGHLVEHYTYDAYGQITGGDTSLTRYLYTGRDLDQTTGLQWNRDRWYDSKTGRFLSEDPWHFRDGPNPFIYGHSSPTNFTDPTGDGGEGQVPGGTPTQYYNPPNNGSWLDTYGDWFNGTIGTGWSTYLGNNVFYHTFGVNVVDMYSTQEVGYIALQCPDYDHYHVMAEDLLVEILDDEGRACEPGQIGKVVVTTLHNFAMPLLRYEVGDYAEVGEPCPCGRGLPVLKRILGRARNLFVLPDGRRRWPAIELDPATAGSLPVSQFQVIQRTLHDVEVKLVAYRPLTPEEEAGLRSHVTEWAGYPFNVTFSYVDNIPRSAGGKYEDFRCEVAADDNGAP